MSRPDHCDGTFDANCDASREYTNISSIISNAGETALLDYMNTYWKDYQGNDESFWEHEWGKHGTCISTLEPACYTDYVPQQEVVAYFQKTVDLFKTLDSYQVGGGNKERDAIVLKRMISFLQQRGSYPHPPSHTRRRQSTLLSRHHEASVLLFSARIPSWTKYGISLM